jgi:hypothetical protein
METLPWNPAAEVTDVTAAQSVQDGGGIKYNSYAFGPTCILRGHISAPWHGPIGQWNCPMEQVAGRHPMSASDPLMTKM